MALEKGRICVTGSSGFLGSWVVKLLLSKDFKVHGTVRDPLVDESYDHLEKFDKASENLKLFKADLLDYNSLYSAIEGCEGVIHIATNVPSSTTANPEVEVRAPAVKGTLNVLKACFEAKVKRAVVVSSDAAVSQNPRWPKDKPKDETCWSDIEYCRTNNNWYFLSKTEAEREALEYGKKTGLDVVTVCPTLILGPLFQPRVNASSRMLLKLLKEGFETTPNKLWNIVDARDLAEALLLLYEKPEAEGRYICGAHAIMKRDLVEKLKSIYPNYNYPKSYTSTDEDDQELPPTSAKLQRLGWTFRPLEETLIGSVESYQKVGILD
ncbi:cinnamoyl-CoA reductase 1-like isoform X2 [Tripterygium wilfordii]|uniref:cinnamoyl-CoA reductase 1-like isoform X2 n=1 Tax=Tripterygium wilfordii TaxID=458696 RepID=UPI0018F84189|nr:cinnamoyl-CoA reductase 1-like isoform X2 [Tripterygium wilfordii]